MIFPNWFVYTGGMLLTALATLFLSLAAFGCSHPKVNYGWLGVLCWFLTTMIYFSPKG